MRFLSMIALIAVVTFSVAPDLAAQNLLADSGFESGGFSAGWTPFGNAQIVASNPPADVPLNGTFALKMFGNFSGGFDVTGTFQQFTCNPGDQFQLDCWSRHYSGDPLIGGGLPADNWCVMKISFFDNAGEIPGVSNEAVILDGNSPTDTWIDNAPITATAPAGVIHVQALLLFLQPLNDGGAGYFDDVEFELIGSTPATYPGTGDDLSMTTGINGAPDMVDVKSATGGDWLAVNVSTPAGTFDLVSYFLLAQLVPTGGVVSVPGLPELWLDLTLPIALLVDPTIPSPVGPQVITPGTGNNHAYLLPPISVGQSLTLQTLVLSNMALNNIYATTDAHEIVIN